MAGIDDDRRDGGTAGRRRRQRPTGEDLAAGMDGTPYRRRMDGRRRRPGGRDDDPARRWMARTDDDSDRVEILPRGWDGSHAANDRRWRTPWTGIDADNTAADVKTDGRTIAARARDDSPDERSGSGVGTNAGRLSPLAGHTAAVHRLRRPARPAR